MNLKWGEQSDGDAELEKEPVCFFLVRFVR